MKQTTSLVTDIRQRPKVVLAGIIGGMAIAGVLFFAAPGPLRTLAATLQGDINGDGRVDIFDLSILLANFGKSIAATPTPTPTSTNTPTSTPTPSPTSVTGGGNGHLLYNGTFGSSSPGPNYPTIYGSCFSNINAQEEQFTINSSCNPAGNGHYRTDLSSPFVYHSGTAMCTTVPINFVNVPTVPSARSRGWMVISETKDFQAQGAAWSIDVSSDFDGRNELNIAPYSYGGAHDSYAASVYHTTNGLESGWHTWSLCSDNQSSGTIYSIWHDGQRLSINYGPASGKQSVSGVGLAPNDGASSWPMTTDDYTGGSPANTIIHGATLISTIGSNGMPPEPAGGWTSP